jgi:hypothetical protein
MLLPLHYTLHFCVLPTTFVDSPSAFYLPTLPTFLPFGAHYHMLITTPVLPARLMDIQEEDCPPWACKWNYCRSDSLLFPYCCSVLPFWRHFVPTVWDGT